MMIPETEEEKASWNVILLLLIVTVEPSCYFRLAPWSSYALFFF